MLLGKYAWLVLVGGTVIGLAAAAQDAPGVADQFAFSPMPRWVGDPENDQVCAAVKKECAGAWKRRQEDFEIEYELSYQSDGTLSGMRIIKSSSCKPVDEYYQMFKRSMLFSPKLEDVRAELAEGVRPEDVRLIKTGQTNFSLVCPR